MENSKAELEQEVASEIKEADEDEPMRDLAMEDRIEENPTDTESQPLMELKSAPRKKGHTSTKVNLAQDINEKYLRIETELNANKEKLYAEYMNDIMNEMKGIQDGTSPEYEERLQMLMEEREYTINQANAYRKYLLEVSERIYNEEIEQADEYYKQERDELKEKLLADVEERKKRLKEEQANYDLLHDAALEASTRQNSRKLRERIGIKEIEPKPKRPKTTVTDILYNIKKRICYLTHLYH
ncbi:hypothetical protein G9A89_009545 [Geosiphon pyriformis]|nr:hypothetical protein G9A89_009545 [Geosiphon pyriformis]